MFTVSRVSLRDRLGFLQNCTVVHVDSQDKQFLDQIACLLLQAVEVAYPNREAEHGDPNFIVVPNGYDMSRLSYEDLIADLRGWGVR